MTAPEHDPACDVWAGTIRVGTPGFYNTTTGKWTNFNDLTPYLRARVSRELVPCIATATVADDGDQA